MMNQQTMIWLSLCVFAVAILTGCATWTYCDYVAGTDIDVVASKRKMTQADAVNHIRSIVMKSAPEEFGNEEPDNNMWSRWKLTRCDVNGYTCIERGALRPDKYGQILTSGMTQWDFLNRNLRFQGQSSFAVTNEVRYADITHLKISVYKGVPHGVQAYAGTNMMFGAVKSDDTLAALEILCTNLSLQGRMVK
jgi:hypothetical protein